MTERHGGMSYFYRNPETLCGNWITDNVSFLPRKDSKQQTESENLKKNKSARCDKEKTKMKKMKKSEKCIFGQLMNLLSIYWTINLAKVLFAYKKKRKTKMNKEEKQQKYE